MNYKKGFSILFSALLGSCAFASCHEAGTQPIDPQKEGYEVYHNMSNFVLNEETKFDIYAAGDGAGKMKSVFDEDYVPSTFPQKEEQKGLDYSNYMQIARDGNYFGSPSKVVIYYDTTVSGAKEKVDMVHDRIDARLTNLDSLLSVENPKSDITRFNEAKAGATVEIGEVTYHVVEDTLRLYQLTDGAYNPSVRLSVDLWGFSPRFQEYRPNSDPKPYDRENYTKELPQEKYIKAFQKISDYENVKLSKSDGKYYITKSESRVTVDGVEYTMQLDLGGYGKGVAADIALEEMKNAGFDYGYAMFGGSSYSFGKTPREKTEGGEQFDFSISLKYPSFFEGSMLGLSYGKLFGHDGGLSTSGNYEQFYTCDDVQYCHIIDPFTGSPIRSNVCTATIVGGSAAENDALTTALCVMGKEKAMEFTNRHLTDKKVIFVYHREATK